MTALGAMPQELNGPFSSKQQDSNPSPAQNYEEVEDTTSGLSEPQAEEVKIIRLDDDSVQEPSDAKQAQDAKDDKWALNDDDRMTSDEIENELFGGDDPKSEDKLDSSKLSNEDGESDWNTEEENNAERKSDENQKRLAPRQTIESYLKGINSLTIDTYTPPVKNGEANDVPRRIMPPIMSTANRSYRVTDIRYQTPDIYHNPLYFEDRAAERSGVTRGLRQPIVSARKFASDVLTLPRKIHKARPRSCEYRQNLRYSQPVLIRN